jgi:hypothetical protein
MTADAALTVRLLTDALERVHDDLHVHIAGLDVAALSWRPDPEANSMGWLVWHLSRVADDHFSGIATELDLPGQTQRWLEDGWYERFSLPFDQLEHGYGQTSTDVAAVRVSADLLLGYYDDVHVHSLSVLSGLRSDSFDRIVDVRWTPHVTAAVRLVSIVNELAQHTGQVGYLRGMWERR